jgi:hypothetical protein
MSQSKILRHLGDNLVLRRSSPADADALAEFNAFIHGDPDENFLDRNVAVWTQDLLTRPHPTFAPDDFTIVEDTQTGKIVSSLNLISQTWTYAGIPFKVGRPELVGTDPAYRHKGLVRAQFETVHQWSAERGELVQGITGIPYYYRLFGYEMALNLSGGRVCYLPQIPELEKDQSEPYRIRAAVESDLPFIADTDCYGRQRDVVGCVRDQTLWQYEVFGKSPENVNRFEMCIIENAASEPVGYLAHSPVRWGGMMPLNFYELQPGMNWAAVTPSVMRYIRQVGESRKPYRGEKPLDAVGMWLGEKHPAYEVVASRLGKTRPPYAWYIRVPDLPAFLRVIAPALEKRLAASHLAGYTGELKITFYRDGLLLGFEQGRLVKAEPYKPSPVGHSGQAAFPGLTFLQLVFCYRSLDELKYAFPDCSTETDEAAAMLDALFPRQPSDVWPIS